MPITICHPALAMPLRRFGFVLSALVIGSMIPDFEFFLRLSDGKGIGHTFIGVFLFDIPVGLIALILLHKLIKFPIMSLMPQHFQSRLYLSASTFRFFPLNRFLNIILSLTLGIITHFICDAFTHADGWVVENIKFLSAPVFIFPQGTIRVYFLLQYLGSAFFAMFLFYWTLLWYYNENPINHIVLHQFNNTKRMKIILVIGLFSITTGIIYGLLSANNLQSMLMLKTFITHSTIATMSSFIVSLITFGIAWHYWIPHHKRIQYCAENPQYIVSKLANTNKLI